MQRLLRRPLGKDAVLAEGIIRNLPLFQGTDPQTIKQAALQAKLQRLARGQAAYRRGDELPGLFAVAYGSLKLRLAETHGGEIVVRLVAAGETLAEAPALLGVAAHSEAVALSDCMLVVLPTACARALIERDPRLARNLVETLAERTLSLQRELEAGLQTSRERLAAYLDSIAQPAETAGTWIAALPVSKTLLAARLGVKKETLSRLLRQLEQRGLIQMEKGTIRIPDRAALRKLLGRG